MGIAIGFSFLVVPTWFTDFISQVVQYDALAGTPYRSLTWIILRHFISAGLELEVIVTAGFVLGALAVFWRFRNAKGDAMLWATGMVLLLTNFIAPRMATTGYAVLLIALFLLFKRRVRSGLAVVGIELALLVGQWAIFLGTMDGNFETAAVYLPFPLLLLFGLLLDRPLMNRGYR